MPVNRVAAGTCTVVAPRLNTVQRIVCIGDIIVPGKMPAQIFDVGSPGCAGAVGFVRYGKLTVQHRGIVAVIRKIKQQNTGLSAGSSHDAVVIR